jgi:hypothetical protein
MSRTEVLLVILGLLINDVGDWCHWLARQLVRWSARHRYAGDSERVAIRAEELEALIDDRPGNLCKFGTALGFAVAAVIARCGQDARGARGAWGVGMLRVARRGIGVAVILRYRPWTTAAAVAAIGIVVCYALHSPTWVLAPVLLLNCAAVLGALAAAGHAGDVESLLSSGLFVLGGTPAASTLDDPPPRQPLHPGPARDRTPRILR